MTYLSWFLIGAMTLAVFVPFHPGLYFPGRDNGVFLYAGWRVLIGEIPYADFWDHKPPLIYFINALGLWLGQGNAWGVWFLELILLFASSYLSFHITKKLFGNLIALGATLTWLIVIFPVTMDYEGGNLTEDYALLFQFLCMWCYFKLISRQEVDTKLTTVWFLLLGFSGTACFLLKQTTIDTAISAACLLIFYSLLSSGLKLALRVVLYLFIGIIPLILILLLYFIAYDAWISLVQAFNYNFAYLPGYPLLVRLSLTWAGIGKYQLAPGIYLCTVVIVLSAIVVVLLKIIKIKKGVTYFAWPGPAAGHMVLLATMSFIISFFLISLSGRNYPHYFTSIIPSASILIAYFFYMASAPCRVFLSNPGIIAWFCLFVCLTPLVVFSGGSHRIQYKLRSIAVSRPLAPSLEQLKVMVQAKPVEPTDTILFWGAEAGWNFLLKRRAPTRFVYQYPLWQSNYVTPEMINEFTDSLISQRPLFIVDTHNKAALFLLKDINDTIKGNDSVCPANSNTSAIQYPLMNNWKRFQEWFACNYSLVGSLKNGWEVYGKR